MRLSPSKMKTMEWLSQVKEVAHPLSWTRPYWVRSYSVRDKNHRPCPPVPPEQHPYCEFNIVMEGSGHQFIGPERFSRRTGDLMLLGPGIPHYGVAETFPQKTVTVFFLPTLLFELGPQADGRKILSRFTSSTPAQDRLIRPSSGLFRNLSSYFDEMLTEFEKPRFGSEVRFRALLGLSLTELLRWEEKQNPVSQPTTGIYNWAVIERVLGFIHTHYREEVYVQDLAKFAGLSQGRLQSTFRRAMGMSCMQYLRSYRISHACALLCLPGARVTEVAMEVGFETLSHFNLSFRRFCECSPTEYIRRRGRGR